MSIAICSGSIIDYIIFMLLFMLVSLALLRTRFQPFLLPLPIDSRPILVGLVKTRSIYHYRSLCMSAKTTNLVGLFQGTSCARSQCFLAGKIIRDKEMNSWRIERERERIGERFPSIVDLSDPILYLNSTISHAVELPRTSIPGPVTPPLKS